MAAQGWAKNDDGYDGSISNGVWDYGDSALN